MRRESPPKVSSFTSYGPKGHFMEGCGKKAARTGTVNGGRQMFAYCGRPATIVARWQPRFKTFSTVHCRKGPCSSFAIATCGGCGAVLLQRCTAEAGPRTWMAGTSPAMTTEQGRQQRTPQSFFQCPRVPDAAQMAHFSGLMVRDGASRLLTMRQLLSHLHLLHPEEPAAGGRLERWAASRHSPALSARAKRPSFRRHVVPQ
jgi:hypothetical protein